MVSARHRDRCNIPSEVVFVRRSKLQAVAKRRPKSAKRSVQTIAFYRANEKPYGAFSNLFRRSLEFEGAIYPTSEVMCGDLALRTFA
jgi:predicted NAD-dependent protein-ADP-ribosyltransferase YbiA (DUF1768 family)